MHKPPHAELVRRIKHMIVVEMLTKKEISRMLGLGRDALRNAWKQAKEEAVADNVGIPRNTPSLMPEGSTIKAKRIKADKLASWNTRFYREVVTARNEGAS